MLSRQAARLRNKISLCNKKQQFNRSTYTQCQAKKGNWLSKWQVKRKQNQTKKSFKKMEWAHHSVFKIENNCPSKGRWIVVDIQLFRERLSGKVHATILKGIVGGFEFSFFQRNLKELARKAMEMCLRVLKKSNNSRIDSYSVRNSVLIISHITFWDCRVHSFYDNLSRNSCIPRREVSRYIFRSTMNRHWGW